MRYSFRHSDTVVLDVIILSNDQSVCLLVLLVDLLFSVFCVCHIIVCMTRAVVSAHVNLVTVTVIMLNCLSDREKN